MTNDITAPVVHAEGLPVCHRGAIYPWHHDHMGHMNVQHYIGKFDEATWNLFALFGVTAKTLREDGYNMAALQQDIRYKAELVAGDIIAVTSRIERLSNKTVTFSHEMRNLGTGAVSAQIRNIACFINSATRQSMAIPEDLRAQMTALVTEHDAICGTSDG
ncbi:thioesterase [Alphaproteobacteria bacterium HT1-32]|nr:thioesterase [Alphaproteobacteria bacterium HT1-32]